MNAIWGGDNPTIGGVGIISRAISGAKSVNGKDKVEAFIQRTKPFHVGEIILFPGF